MQNYKLNGVKWKMSFLTAGIAFMVALCHATEFPWRLISNKGQCQ